MLGHEKQPSSADALHQKTRNATLHDRHIQKHPRHGPRCCRTSLCRKRQGHGFVYSRPWTTRSTTGLGTPLCHLHEYNLHWVRVLSCPVVSLPRGHAIPHKGRNEGKVVVISFSCSICGQSVLPLLRNH